ncbi:NUDIX domain-containing protein [Candidatus Woesearchaeota archaeon]|nr:NUDIX domain-containing protein [Candidatus Woesearchaeota archaeon]
MRIAIGAAIIDEGRILLVRKKQSWILPGGKPEPHESDIECLCREVGEELSGTQLEHIQYYGDFEGVAPHQGDILKVKVYFADVKGQLYRPAAEITACDWADNPSKYNLSDITSKIVDSLIGDGHLKRSSD